MCIASIIEVSSDGTCAVRDALRYCVNTHNFVGESVTLAAMKEAESGAVRDVPALDLSSIEAMEKSMGL